MEGSGGAGGPDADRAASYPSAPAPSAEGTTFSTPHTMFAISSRRKRVFSSGAPSITFVSAGGRKKRVSARPSALLAVIVNIVHRCHWASTPRPAARTSVVLAEIVRDQQAEELAHRADAHLVREDAPVVADR